MNEPVGKASTEDKPASWSVLVLIFIIGLVVFVIGGKYLYGLGMKTAFRLEGGELTAAVAVSTMTMEGTPTMTLTPLPTNTPFYIIPTATATQIPWTTCPGMVVTTEDTKKGDVFHILRCSDGFEYEIGPLAKGVFAISPKDEYFVYFSNDGKLYVAQTGSTSLRFLRDLEREGAFTIFNKGVEPDFRLSFQGDAPYQLKIVEWNYKQKYIIDMPRWLTEAQ